MALTDFILPEDLRSAKAALRKLGDKGLVLAGGTSLHFLGSPARTAVDLSRLGLSGIRKKGGSFHVGATTTLDDLLSHRGAGWVLDQVALHTSTQQVRNISTLGGNLARVFPWNDFPVALLALDATVVVDGTKEKAFGADEFFEGQPALRLKPGQLITRIEVPVLKKGQGFGYHKETRLHAGFSLVTAAARVTVKDGRIKEVRVAVGAGVLFPCRLPLLEKALEGQPTGSPSLAQAVASGTVGVAWKGKEGLSDEYTAHLGRVVLGDVLAAALQQAKGE